MSHPGNARPFLGKVLVLLSGTALAQAIPILAAPALARLYAPEAFGEFGVYSSVLATVAVGICLRYEHAILLEKDPGSVGALSVLCAAITLAMALIATLATIVLHLPFLPSTMPARMMLALPLGISLGLTGLTQTISMLCLREERFRLVAISRVTQAILATGASLALALLSSSGQSLIWAAVMGQAALLFALLCNAPLSAWARPGYEALSQQTTQLLKTYRRFPLFTVPADLMSALNTNLPVFYITASHGPGMAGAYVFAQRILSSPLSILGSALMDTYKQSATSLQKQGQSFRSISLKTSSVLGAIVVPAGAAAYFLAPPVIRLAFGEAWEASGTIIQILLPAVLLRLIATPISYNFYIRERQFEDMLAQSIGFACSVLLFQVCAHLNLTVLTTLSLYSVNLCVFYLYYLVRSNQIA